MIAVHLSDATYKRLKQVADSRNVSVSHVIDRMSRRRDPVRQPLAELPARPRTALDSQKAFVIEAAAEGWTTTEILIATNDKGWTLTRAFVNETRRKAGYPANQAQKGTK